MKEGKSNQSLVTSAATPAVAAEPPAQPHPEASVNRTFYLSRLDRFFYQGDAEKRGGSTIDNLRFVQMTKLAIGPPQAHGEVARQPCEDFDTDHRLAFENRIKVRA